MAYATLEDMNARITRRELEGITIDDPSGMNQPEIDAAVLAAADQALAEASGLIDDYCRGKYPVPFNPVPVMVKQTCVDIAVNTLYGRRDGGSEDCRNRYKSALTFLRDVADGRVKLSGGQAGPKPESQPVRITSSHRVFSRSSMRGF